MAWVGPQYDIYVVSRNGSIARNVSRNRADEYSPTWSPDGSKLAWAREPPDGSARGWVVIADPDGSNQVEIREPADLAPPMWAPAAPASTATSPTRSARLAERVGDVAVDAGAVWRPHRRGEVRRLADLDLVRAVRVGDHDPAARGAVRWLPGPRELRAVW